MQKNLISLELDQFDLKNKINKNKTYIGKLTKKNIFKSKEYLFGTENNILELTSSSNRLLLNSNIAYSYLSNQNCNKNTILISPINLWDIPTFNYLKSNYNIREIDLQQIAVIINDKKILKGSKNLIESIFNIFNMNLNFLSNENSDKPVLLIIYYENWLKSKKDYIIQNGMINEIVINLLNIINSLKIKFKVIYGLIEKIGRIEISKYENVQHILINQDIKKLSEIGYGVEEIFMEQSLIKILKNNFHSKYSNEFSEIEFLTFRYFCDKIGVNITTDDFFTNLKNLLLIFNKDSVFYLERF